MNIAFSIFPFAQNKPGSTSLLRRAARVLSMAIALCWFFWANGASAASTTWLATGLTVPPNGVILTGSGINPATNLPYRHLWFADHLQGFCRMDPDVDSSASAHTLNVATCLPGAVPQGPTVFDPATNNVYFADGGAKGLGVVKVKFLPAGDGGHGTIDLNQQVQLGAAGNGCGLPGNRTMAISLGPDGHLYVGVQKNGNITRILNPSSSANIPCSSFQTIGATPDGRRTLGLAWVGHDLFGLDGGGPFQIALADRCMTPNNGNQTCRGTSILAAGAIAAPSAIASDQNYPSVSGKTLYIGDVTSVVKVQAAGLVMTSSWGTGVTFPSGLTVDTSNPANPVVFAGDDPTNGAGQLQGKIVRMADEIVAAAPGTPTAVKATAADSSATVSWTPGNAGSSATTYYTVHTSGSAVADQSTTPGAAQTNSLFVTGLTNGQPYTFTVDATNAVGTSTRSAASLPVTPVTATIPGAPTNVSAVAGNASALVAWSAPSSDGGSPILGYTVSYSNGGSPVAATTAASATGATITGLTNGVGYTFTVHATNAKGDGPTAASGQVIPDGPGPTTNVAMTMAAPVEVASGADVVYAMTVTNTGTTDISQVVLTDTLPANGFASASIVTTKGVCSSTAPSTMSCNLGPMVAGATAGVTLTLTSVTSAITNSATVKSLDGAGNLVIEANASDNSASVTTNMAPPPPPEPTTTDLQVSGSASSGSPALNANVVYTWQVRNSGKEAANGVSFTDVLPGSLRFVQASATLGGTCTAPPVGSSGPVACSLPTLAAGQSMSVSVTAQVIQRGTTLNSGTVNFAGTDSKPGNNTANVQITVR